jgi:hypothetical protein
MKKLKSLMRRHAFMMSAFSILLLNFADILLKHQIGLVSSELWLDGLLWVNRGFETRHGRTKTSKKKLFHGHYQ